MTLLYEFLSRNKQLIPLLPLSIQKRTSPEPGPPERDSRTARIYDYNPYEFSTQFLLAREYHQWVEQPSSFFVLQEQRPCYGEIDSQYGLILDCLNLKQVDAHSRILRRFYSIGISRLRSVRRNGGDGDDADAPTIARAIFPFVYPNTSPEGHLLNALADEIQTLIQAGPRYENIALRLGCLGSLFLLGNDIPTNV